MGQLENKICIITGAGTGIGKGIGRAFAKEGATLVIASRNQQNLEETANELRPLGSTILVVPTDVTSEAQVKALFETTMQEFGQLDILINNSGIFDGGPLEDIPLETWKKVLDVNLTGPFLCSREAMKIMKLQKGGRIINIGSISGSRPRMNHSPYTTAKHGLIGLTRSMALEGRAFGVVASAVHPGNVLTERRAASEAVKDQEPMMTVDEFAVTVVMAATLPLHVNMLDTIVLPVEQVYIGRG